MIFWRYMVFMASLLTAFALSVGKASAQMATDPYNGDPYPYGQDPAYQGDEQDPAYPGDGQDPTYPGGGQNGGMQPGSPPENAGAGSGQGDDGNTTPANGMAGEADSKQDTESGTGLGPGSSTDSGDNNSGSGSGSGTDSGSGGGQSASDLKPFPSGIDMRRIIARQQAGAVWRRFSPQWRSILAAGRLSTTATPVAGESLTAQGWSLWLDGAWSRMKDRNPARASKGHAIGSTLGLDFALTPGTVLGFGVNRTYSDSKGTLAQTRERTHNTFASLYLSHQFTDWLSVDVQGGYVYQRQKRKRITALGVVHGKRHSHGYMVSGALNAWKWVSPQVMLSGRLGIIASRDRWRAYAEYGPLGVTPRPPQTEALVQGVLEAGVSWWLEPVMPRLSISYNRDLYRKGVALPGDRDDFTLSGGLSWFGSGAAEGLSFDVGAEVIVGREKQRNWGISASLKWSW